MQRSTFVILLFFAQLACVAQKTMKTETPKYARIATEKYGVNIDYEFNVSRAFVLCIHQDKATDQLIYPPLSYFVYDISGDSILYEQSHEHGHVTWINDEQFAVSLISGIISGVEETDAVSGGYIYDVWQRKRITEKQKDSKNRK